MAKHGRYLIIASYKSMPTKAAPTGRAAEQGWKQASMGQDLSYQLDAYLMPAYYSGGKRNWKDLASLSKVVSTAQFDDEEVVSAMESLTLEIHGAKSLNA